MKTKKKVLERPEAAEMVLKERRGERDTRAARIQIAHHHFRSKGGTHKGTRALVPRRREEI